MYIISGELRSWHRPLSSLGSIDLPTRHTIGSIVPISLEGGDQTGKKPHRACSTFRGLFGHPSINSSAGRKTYSKEIRDLSSTFNLSLSPERRRQWHGISRVANYFKNSHQYSQRPMPAKEPSSPDMRGGTSPPNTWRQTRGPGMLAWQVCD